DLFDDLDAGGAQIQRRRLARPRPKPAAKRSVLGALPFARAVGDRVLLRRGCQAERRLAVGRGAGAVVPREVPGHGALRTVTGFGGLIWSSRTGIGLPPEPFYSRWSAHRWAGS